MGNEGSSLDGGVGLQRVVDFDPLCVWKGRLRKSKIRRNWKSRLVYMCHNANNDDLFLVYFSDSGVSRYIIDLRRGYVTHIADRKLLVVSTVGDDIAAEDSDNDDVEDNGLERESDVWLLRYEEPDAGQAFVRALETLQYRVDVPKLEGWLEKRTRRLANVRQPSSQLPALKRYAMLLPCGDLIYFRDDECTALRGRLFLPACSKIFCEEGKFTTDSADAYQIVIEDATRHMLLKVCT